MACTVCKSDMTKYKCPTCRAPYCSAACCKEHKKTHLENCKDNFSKENEPPSQVQDNKAFYNYPTEDTVPPEKLQLLEGSEHLQNILCNPHIRSLLTAVNSATNPDEVISSAMLEPIFVEFADECLRLVEPPSEEELYEAALTNGTVLD